jgi:hypothetical protein
MKLKEFKQKLNELPSEMDDFEVCLKQFGVSEIDNDVDIGLCDVFRVNFKLGGFYYTDIPDEFWLENGRKVTHSDVGNTVEKETVLMIS